jgi:hypothetical protein
MPSIANGSPPSFRITCSFALAGKLRAFSNPGLIMSCSLLDLPDPFWARLFEHLLEDGRSSLAAAAAFEQTCQAVFNRTTYTNLHLEVIRDPAHPCWAWLERRLERRLGRISGLDLHVDQSSRSYSWQGLSQAWQHPMSLLAQVPGLRLKLSTPYIWSVEYGLARAFLQQHGHLISTLSMTCTVHVPDYQQELQNLVPEQCLDLQLTCSPAIDEFDFANLQPLAGKLSAFTVEEGASDLEGMSTLTALSKLTYLSFDVFPRPVIKAEPWAVLATLTGLQHLACTLDTTGDAAPLSVLTGLTSLILDSDSGSTYLSTLQPLTALQQLQELSLGAFSTTSLHGLGALSSLRRLEVGPSTSLISLEGLNPTALTKLTLEGLPNVSSVAGLSGLQCLRELIIGWGCEGITSLEPLSHLQHLAIM